MVVANFTGSDASGSSGDASRVLTLSNTSRTVSADFLVFVSGLALTETTEYTVSHNSTNSTVTFVNPLWDDMTIIVHYFTSPPSVGTSTAVLNQRFIQKEIQSTGNLVDIIEVGKDTGSDEYRTISENTTTQSDIRTWIHVLNEEDEIVKQGTAVAGDLVFWFDSDQESYCIAGNRITWDSKTYQISSVHKFDVNTVTYLIRCAVKQI